MSSLKLAFIGDVMCGDSFNKIGFGVASMLDKYGREFCPQEIVDIFESHDMVLCNVECVISDVGRKENSLRRLHMRAKPIAAKYLADWGITVANLANNHILEQGVDAAIDTAKNLTNENISVVGAGPENTFQPGIAPLDLIINETQISIISACFHTSQYAYRPGSFEEVIEAVKIRTKDGKYVIVTLHWGDEIIDRPNLRQRQMKEKLIAAGAKLVIGHHPHVPHGIDDSNGTLTAYSLGNFIFDDAAKATDWSFILSVTVNDGKIAEWKAIPIVRGPNYRPMLAVSDYKKQLECEIERRSLLSNQIITDHDAYKKEFEQQLQQLETRYRRRLWKNLAKRFVRLHPIYWPQLLMRPIQRRLGKW